MASRDISFYQSPRQVSWRKWVFQIHLWLGLTLGLVVGIVGLTGAIVVFRYELNRMTVPGTAYVTEQAERRPLDDIYAAVRNSRPNDKILQASWEVGPSVAWNFRATSPEGERIHTFVDQYRAVVTGQENYTHKWMQWFFDLHAYLLADKTGEFLNGFIAISAIILSIAGLILWWPGAKNWRFGFTFLRGARWQRQNYDLHKLIGFYFSLALAFVAFTGAYFAFPNVYKSAAEKLTGTKVETEGPKAKTKWADRHVPMEEFIRKAEALQPGTHSVSFSFPQKAGDAVSVRLKEANDWHRIGYNYVYFEPADATVLKNVRFSEGTLGTKLIQWIYPFHFGRFGGRFAGWAFYGVMVLYVLVGLAPFVLMVSGIAMYWNRSLSKRF